MITNLIFNYSIINNRNSLILNNTILPTIIDLIPGNYLV